MTTPEHTLVGIHTAFAFGVHRRFGWTIVALAGIASNVPDWDGLPMLVDMSRFESGHRAWGHNFFAILISSVMLAWSQHRYRWIESIAIRWQKYLPTDEKINQPVVGVPWIALFLVCVGVQVIHLPCDMVVSGGGGLSDWYIKPFWPISNAGYVYALIPWGDIGPTLIMMSGVIIMARSADRLRQRSACTLAVLLAYLVIRGWARGAL